MLNVHMPVQSGSRTGRVLRVSGQARNHGMSMKRVLFTSALIGWTAVGAAAAEFTVAESGAIAKKVGEILEFHHYRQAKLDDTVSQMFLTNYLEALDYNHLFFLQADADEFASRYGKALDDLTLKADTGPAFEIFNRYRERLTERQQGIETLLKEETNLPINTVDDPLSCVVLGTGKILDDFEHYSKVLMPAGRR